MPSLLLLRVWLRDSFQAFSRWVFTEFFKIFTLGGAHSRFSLSDLIQDCLYVHCCILLILC